MQDAEKLAKHIYDTVTDYMIENGVTDTNEVIRAMNIVQSIFDNDLDVKDRLEVVSNLKGVWSSRAI